MIFGEESPDNIVFSLESDRRISSMGTLSEIILWEADRTDENTSRKALAENFKMIFRFNLSQILRY